MTEMLWMNDCYVKEWDATIVNASGCEIELDKTAFYPEAGGQPSDTGKIVCNGNEYNVISSKKSGSSVVHVLDREGLSAGNAVRCSLDWDKRYKFMRFHTACHVISAVFHSQTGALITGNQIYPEKARIDFNMENFDKEKIAAYVEKANEITRQSHAIKIYSMKREDALKIPSITKLANVLPPSISELRIVEIEGVDMQADGGCHVANTNEIGTIKITKMENKGKNNRRIEFVLE